MKTLSVLSALILLPAAAGAYTVTVTNIVDPNTIRFVDDVAGNPLPTTFGSVSVGYFNGMTDAQVTAQQTSPWGVENVMEKWRAFGPVKRLGTNSQAGAFNLTFSAPLSTGSQFYNKKVYIMIGNRETLWASTSLIVVRSSKTFTGSTGTSYTLPAGPYSGTLFGSSLSNSTFTSAEPPKPTFEAWLEKWGTEYAVAMGGQNGDPDEDGLLNFEEWENCLNPCTSDTDSDTITDWEEVYPGVPIPQFGNVPRVAATNPRSSDTDGDGTQDGDEYALGTNPVLALSRPVISSGMAGFWPLDGHPADLLSGRVLAGAGGKWSASSTHKAMRLDGNSLTAPVQFPAASPGFALAFRLRISAHTQADQVLAAVPGVWSLQCIGTSGRLRFTFGSRSVETTADFTNGAMHQIALSAAWHSRIELWVDGALQARSLEAPERPAASGTLVIGSHGLKGWLDEMILWNRFLTQSDMVSVTTAAGSNWCLTPGHDEWRVRATWQETADDGSSRFCMAWPLCETGGAVLQASPDLVSAWQNVGIPADPFHAERIQPGVQPRFFRVVRP